VSGVPVAAGAAALGYAAALLTAGVLVAAAVAKVRRPSATVDGFRRLGLPLPTFLATVVPAVELGSAALLVSVPRAGGVAALALLASFSAVLAARLRAGIVVSCACFGAGATEALSAADLVRNGLLALFAAAALLAPAPVAPGIDAVVAVTAAAAGAAVVVALARLTARTGRLWDNRLPPADAALEGGGG
jgi:uncharacterized membrane protein YphA (DoxX/SURF4 family)